MASFLFSHELFTFTVVVSLSLSLSLFSCPYFPSEASCFSFPFLVAVVDISCINNVLLAVVDISCTFMHHGMQFLKKLLRMQFVGYGLVAQSLIWLALISMFLLVNGPKRWHSIFLRQFYFKSCNVERTLNNESKTSKTFGSGNSLPWGWWGGGDIVFLDLIIFSSLSLPFIYLFFAAK